MFNLTKLKRTVKCNKWKKIVALFFHLNLLLHRSSLNNFHVFVLIVSNIVNVQVIITDTSTFDCLSIHGTQKAHFVQVLGFERTSDFKIQRRGRQRERHKDNRFNKQNNNFARTSHFFCTFLSRFCTNTTWKCLISRFMENANKQRRNLNSGFELKYGPLKFNFRRVRLQLTK